VAEELTLETHVGAVADRVLLTLSWPDEDGPSAVVHYTPDGAAAVAHALLRAAREASAAPHLGREPP
jgi:hypothetical protein